MDPHLSVIELFRQAFPESPKHDVRHVGIEEEMVVVDARGEMGNVPSILPLLVEQGWTAKNDPVTGALITVKKDDIEISTDIGVGVLEVSFPHVPTLHIHAEQRESVLALVDTTLERFGFRRIRDYSAQPVTVPLREHWAAKGRGYFFRDFFCPAVHAQTASASSQCHVDATIGEVVPALEMFLSLTCVFTALTANAPVWAGALDPEGMLASRQRFWDRFTVEHGFWNNVYVGSPPRDASEYELAGRPPRSLEELAQFATYAPFIVWVKGDKLETSTTPFGTWAAQQDGELTPDVFLDAFKNHEGTLWWDARPRVPYGTIEVRPACQNAEPLAHHALTLGLMENLEVALRFAREFMVYSEWRAMRMNALKDGIRVPGMRRLCELAIAIAREGLKRRGFDEEIYLEPLMQRVRDNASPGHAKRYAFNHGGIDALLELILT